MAAIAAGSGIDQFRVIIPSKSLPTAIIRSASAISAATSGSCGGRPTVQGWSAGRMPRAANVVTTGACSRSARAATSAPASAWTAPPPTHRTLRGDRGVVRSGAVDGQRGNRGPRLGQDIGRDVEVDRAARTGHGGADGLGHGGGGVLRGPRPEHRLGQRFEDARLVAALVQDAA